MEKYLSTFDAARICHVSPGSVIRWVREGKLPAAKTAGGHRRIRLEDLKVLLHKLGMPVPTDLDDESARGPQPPKVLIVDDEEGIRKMIIYALEREIPGVQIEEADEGFIAGWKAHSFCPDLVLLDLMLPGMNGFQICQFIRSFPELKHTKIIAISGLRGADREEQILKLGADRFLAKPFDMDRLRKMIFEFLPGAFRGGDHGAVA